MIQRQDNGPVRVGQRYRVAGTRGAEWEVRAVVRFAGEPIPHAVLAHGGKSKVISLHALADPWLYRLVPPAPSGRSA